jgi:thiol-disulfide isomerase/thioredoxin
MKKLVLCSFVLLMLPVRADDPATQASTAVAATSEEKCAPDELPPKIKSMGHDGDSSPAAWAALDGRLDHYQKQYGDTPQTTHNIVMLRRRQYELARHLRDQARFDALVQKLNADPLPGVKAVVARMVDLKSKPFELQFTATDGTTVDLSKLRGKVVLVDFWATWCPPCRGEVPTVVAAYQKYHDQGFEIVGISLDQDKDALLAYTKSNAMPWPQYFDGNGWENQLSTSFDIHLIPNMWLIDKKGMLSTIFARDDLAGKVEKLLAAP